MGKKFQSAPLAEARGDPTVRRGLLHDRCFNPLPSPKQGEIRTLCPNRRWFLVSIRSPRRSKGRSHHPISLTIFAPFQSAPLAEARGDRRGKKNSLLDVVSIRSPRRSKGRWQYALHNAVIIKFQSAPLAEARGDITEHYLSEALRCFNPLPSPKQGEMKGLIGFDVSKRVSIRSPRRSKGRCRAPAPISDPHEFQSAPLAEARGDADCRNRRRTNRLCRRMRDAAKRLS